MVVVAVMVSILTIIVEYSKFSISYNFSCRSKQIEISSGLAGPQIEYVYSAIRFINFVVDTYRPTTRKAAVEIPLEDGEKVYLYLISVKEMFATGHSPPTFDSLQRARFMSVGEIGRFLSSATDSIETIRS